MPDDELLTVTELAKYLKVNPWSIYTWANSGEIPAVKMVGRWRFKKSAINRWLHTKSHHPKSPKQSK